MTQDHPPGTDGQGRSSAQNTGTTQGQDELARTFGELARTLAQEGDAEATLAGIVSSAIALVPGAQEGSISVVTGRRHVESRAASSALPARVDALQAETGEGPCLSAVYERQTVRVADMSTETRWPHFAARAAAAGAGAMLSLQLFVEGDNLGALNLFAEHAGAFDDESEHVGLLFATHAAVAYAGASEQEQLRASIATRDLIGMAKGILIERHKVTPDQAFALLTRASQDTQRKLREVASGLVHSGQLPAGPSRPQ